MNTRWPLAVALAASLSFLAHAQHSSIDAAFDTFWSAPCTAEAKERAAAVVETGVSFDEAYRRLREGRQYKALDSGVVRYVRRSAIGVEYQYAVNVPAAYDPARRYRARFQLHGGVMMRHGSAPPESAGGIGALAGDDDQLYIVPFAWDASPWWTGDQVQNLHDILDAVKRLYNLDENHVAVSGVSDGGTGAYYLAMRDTTPYASFLPLNGFWGVLASHDLAVDGPLYPNNLRNKPLFIVNGERDPLYPNELVTPAIEHYRKIGLVIDYRPQAGAGHNTQWWPRVKDSFEAFVRDHARTPLPDRVTWETANPLAFNRAHWLVIDGLGRAPGESTLDDPNLVESGTRLEFGVRSIGSRINRVLPGSNAEQLGLHPGDAVVRLNDEGVRVRLDLEEVFEHLEPGARITLLVARDNAPLELSGVYNPTPVVAPPHELFDRAEPSGRVDVVRTGNTVTAKTRGVTAFTLLLSPDQFDFSKRVKVVANGRTLFNRRVEKSVRTLIKWAAVDNDRTMLFGAELHLQIE
jgi:hypothetical protein